ncbi:hypothetical protein LOK49_LG06G01098 [Camellia lanceoleosa]|uniref:Uncharacterized protein n=1 Tax=Camellia lanceoleosa TaxID=1840588 RepID=A0ACC0HDN0_9ERIC|nr:hypothetical protein LOK49_LG06G01098 [Camellia lanceoleosa]
MSKVVATTLQNGLELSKVQPLQTRVLESILITSFAIVTVFTILPCEYIDGSPIPTLIFRGRPSTFHAFVAFLVFAFSSSLNALLIHNKSLILAKFCQCISIASMISALSLLLWAMLNFTVFESIHVT